MAHTNKDKAVLDILRKKSKGTVAIFDKGDFYKCYEEDAILIANNIFLSDVGLRKFLIGSNEVTYLNLNNAQYTKVVKDLLLLLRYRVEVYEEVGGKILLRAKGVLGNLVDFEDIVSNCVELTELSTLMCARVLGNDYNSENHVSLCFCNAQDMRIVVAEFNDCAHFPLLEQCIVSLNPRECVLLKKDAKTAPNRFKHLEKAIERSNLSKVYMDEISDDYDQCRADLIKILDEKSKDFQFGDGLAQGVHALTSHMQLLNDSKFENSFGLTNYGSVGLMYVSNATLQALEIFSLSGDQEVLSSQAGNGSNGATLFEHLNRCRSQSGRRILREWMRRPLCDLRRIQERLDVVEALCELHSIRQNLHDDLLRRVPDITLLARRLTQKKASLQDCYRLYQLIRLLYRFHSSINELLEGSDPKLHASITELILEPLNHSCAEFQRFIVLIDSTFDVAYCESTGQYRIKPEIDETLAELAEKLAVIDKRAQNILNKLCSKLNTDSVKLESNSEIGYFFRITLKSEKVIRNSTNLKILDTTKGGGVRFINTALEELNVEFCELLDIYESSQAELTKNVISICAGYVPALQTLSDYLGVLDVLTSFAVVASSSAAPYVRPEIYEKGTNVFELCECRHPVIEQAPNMQFIPNDTRLGQKQQETAGKKFIVLTGANMGGKSTYLRSNALAVFMAQMGCFVACSSARFSIIDGIFTRVGAGDFQSKGVSTFMAEMMDCATIFETATENSLIIIDELGRGTSTYDGFGLAWAIAEEIIQRIKCICLFATHFHELSRLQESYPESVENFKVETIVDQKGKLTILYQVVRGVADRSFGVNIAKLVGFPPDVIDDASKMLAIFEKVQC